MIIYKSNKRVELIRLGAALWVMLVFLTSCSDDISDLKKFIRTIKEKPAKHIESMPRFAPLPKFKYPEKDSRRSPFKPIDLIKKQDEFAPDQKRRKEPLEAFPLDALKFVGTWTESGVIWALIKLPDSKINRVHVGNYMGQNYGRILSITTNTITLEEAVKESGKWLKNITKIQLDVSKGV